MAGPLKVQIVYGFTGHGYILKYNIVLTGHSVFL